MAKSTYLELVNRAIQECGISGGSIVTVSGHTGNRQRMVDWVASANIYIQRYYRDWNFLHTQYSTSTIASTKDYIKPSDLGMWDTDSFNLDYSTADNTVLTEIEYKDYRDSYGRGVLTNAQPTNFIIKPNKDLILYPTPDGTYTLTADYWKTPTKLTNDTDTSDIPETFEDVIVHRASMLYAKHEQDNELLQYVTAEFMQAMNDLIANEAPHHTLLNVASTEIEVVVE